MAEERIASVDVRRVTRQSVTRNDDVLAVEDPLEIRIAWDANGDDFDLAAGLLITEGLTRSCGGGHTSKINLRRQKLHS